jgi:transposase
MSERFDYAVFLGLDVGKSSHHGCALTPDGRTVFDKPVPQAQADLEALFQKLLTDHGPVLVVVDQPASIGALAVAVAQATEGVEVAYLPGLVMRRLAQTHPGSAKTDARDAYVIAEAARSTPHTLRSLDVGEEALADLRVLVGFDTDLAGEVTRFSNRIQSLLGQIHPALDRVLGPRLQQSAVLELLRRYGGPTGLSKVSHRQLTTVVTKYAHRNRAQLVGAIEKALHEQTVVIPGTAGVEAVIPKLVETLLGLLAQRAEAAARIEEILAAHPLGKVLTSMPGIGVRTAATILVEVGDISRFPTSGHLAAYAGLAPVTRQSGSSIRAEHRNHGGNKALKRALFLSSFAALANPESRAYYQRKRSEGKPHNAALVCLSRRRVDVLHAMLRRGQPYRHRQSAPVAA